MTRVPVHETEPGYGLVALICNADHATRQQATEYKPLRAWFTLADCQAWHEQALEDAASERPRPFSRDARIRQQEVEEYNA